VTPIEEEAASQVQSEKDAFRQLVLTALTDQRAGQADRALAVARRAEKIAPQLLQPIDLQLSEAHNLLGVVFFQSSYFRSALDAYKRALAMLDGIEAGKAKDSLLASLNNNLGQVYERLGELDRARTHLETAVALLKAIADETKTLGFALDNLASVRGQLGNLTEAEAMHQEALIVFRRLGGPFDPDIATALGNLSRIFSARRDYAKAEAHKLRAIDAHQRTSGLTSGETLTEVAGLIDIYWKAGDEQRADVLLNHLLLLGGTSPSPAQRNLAEMLRQLLKTAFYGFRLDIAQRIGVRAIELLEATEGPNAPETLDAVFELATIYRAVGNRQRAETVYLRARSGYEERQMPDKAVAVTINLAKLYRDAGAYALAAQVLGAALEYLRGATIRDSQEIANTLGNLGLVHFEAGKYKEADAVFMEALSEIQGDPEKRTIDRPWILHNRAMLKYHLEEYPLAVELFQEAKHLWMDQHGPDHPFVATTAANLALVYWAINADDLALSSFREADTLRDHDMQRVLAVGSEKDRADYARELQADLHKVVSFCLDTHARSREVSRFAAQLLLRRKGRVLDAIAHTLFRVREGASPEDRDLLARLQIIREDITALMAPVLVAGLRTEEGQRLRQLRTEEEKVEAALSYRGALYRPDVGPVTLDQVQSQLEEGYSLIEILRYNEFTPKRTGKWECWKEARYTAMVLCPSGDPQWFDLGPAAAIDVKCDLWRRLLCNPGSDIAALNALGTELYGLLIKPMCQAIKEARRLLVSPDGKINLIPFGALHVSGDGLLGDKIGVSYMSSGRELLRSSDGEPQARGIVVIAAPDFDYDAQESASSTAADALQSEGNFGPLLGTEEEADDIDRMLENVTIITGSDATTQRVRELSHPAILHIATHGVFSDIRDEETWRRSDLLKIGETIAAVETISRSEIANPMFSSGLAFAGANHAGRGILTAQEIATLDLRGTVLTVLSACDTGMGSVKAGEEFAGLRRALAIAGAQTQVTSLWKAHDEATRFLVREYYRKLASGSTRAEALELAQTELVEAHPEWKHPAYWAAFISSGAYDAVGDGLKLRLAIREY
jgi:CHAT domain-containing protein/Tfp pilus assembly protein PilF